VVLTLGQIKLTFEIKCSQWSCKQHQTPDHHHAYKVTVFICKSKRWISC